MCSSRRLGLTVAGAAGLRLPYDVSSLEGGGHKSWFRVDISPPLLAEASWPPQVDASCPCRAGQEAGAGWKLLLRETVFAVSAPTGLPSQLGARMGLTSLPRCLPQRAAGLPWWGGLTRVLLGPWGW